MGLKNLIGKTSLDVVLEIPFQKWEFNERFVQSYPKISSLFFVDYDYQKEPLGEKDRDKPDLFEPVNVEELFLSKLKERGLTKKGIGLCSHVLLGSPFEKTEYKEAHIPMIDLDINNAYLLNLPKEQLLDLIKSKIKKTGLQGRGLILSSSEKNYHFVGMEKLLERESFVNFLANCLTDFRIQTPGGIIYLVDSSWIGHSLNSLRHLYPEDLHHSFKRFSTLRITEKNSGPIPKVIDIYEGDKKC